jgi:putative ABC transport system permease protein
VRVIRLLALRRLRLQPLRGLLAAAVVGGGTSLVVTILVLGGSLTASVNEAARNLAGPAPLRVLGPVQRGGLDEADIARVAGTDGVEAVVPLIQSISVVDRRGDGDELPVTVLGFDCSVQEIFGELAEGCSDEVLAGVTSPLVGQALADELEPGAAVHTSLGRVPLADAIALPALDRINDGRVVAFPMPLADAHLGRDGRVDVAYVLTDPGAGAAEVQSRIEDRLPQDFAVLDVLDPPPVVGVVFATFLPLLTVIALLTLGIGGVLVRNSITLSLEERRRQTAIVGALGGSRRLLIGGTVAEVVVLGAVGGLLGVAAGIALAGPVSGGLDDLLRDVAGIPLEITVPGSAVLVGVGLGVGVAVLSAVAPARRAVRIDVAAELASRGRREETASATSARRVLAAMAVIGLGVAITGYASHEAGIDQTRATLAPVGFLTCAVGAVATVAVAVPHLLALGERRLRFRRASTRLALSNLRREPRRSAVMAVALGFAMGVGFITASFKASITEAISDTLNGNLVGVTVSSIDPNNSALNEARLGPEVLDALADLPGVASVERSAYAVLGNEAGELIGVQAFTEVWDGLDEAVGTFTEAGLAEGRVTIGPALARAEGLRPGEDLVLSTPGGQVELPIMAVMYDGNFGGRNVGMDFELMTRLYGEQSPVSVIANPEPGVSEAALRATIEEADLEPGLYIESPDDVVARNAEEVAQQLSTFDAIQRGLLVMSFVAVLSTLLLVGIQRQREFGMLAAVGMTPRELRWMVLAEAGIVAVVGVLVTGVGALIQYWALNEIVPVIVGYRDPFVTDPGAYVLYSAVAVATALVAALYPARRAARVEVLEALRYE